MTQIALQREADVRQAEPVKMQWRGLLFSTCSGADARDAAGGAAG